MELETILNWKLNFHSESFPSLIDILMASGQRMWKDIHVWLQKMKNRKVGVDFEKKKTKFFSGISEIIIQNTNMQILYKFHKSFVEKIKVR